MQAGVPKTSDLDSLAESLAKRVLAADEKTDVRPDPRPLPAKKGNKAQKEYLRAKAQKILELRVRGFSFDEIAQQMDYKSGKHARTAYERLMQKHEAEDAHNLRQLQAERLEMAWRGLAPKIQQGRERAVEVGMKVMERQAKLYGIDLADAKQEPISNQPIQISIMAHPGDPRAQAMIIDSEPIPLLTGESEESDEQE